MRKDYKETDSGKKILITGAAGFIGFHLSKALLEKGLHICGIDNLNDYYDVKLKEDRLSILKGYGSFHFIRGNIADADMVNKAFAEFEPDIVINLAAQAGVRYSLENPQAYMESNMMGFFHILEACRHSSDNGKRGVEHLLFASSSSVYGNRKEVPFSASDSADRPVSLYAATKKSNELMAYAYSHLYKIPATGLRFFTVYGPYGRPDMAYFGFSDKICKGQPVQIFNGGRLYRDFTYIDDIVEGIVRMISNPPLPDEDGERYKVYNIGNNHPEKLMDFVSILEKVLGRKAVIEYLPMQPGDVFQTYADVTELMEDFDFKPDTSLEAGLKKFADWYLNYYNI